MEVRLADPVAPHRHMPFSGRHHALCAPISTGRAARSLFTLSGDMEYRPRTLRVSGRIRPFRREHYRGRPHLLSAARAPRRCLEPVR